MKMVRLSKNLLLKRERIHYLSFNSPHLKQKSPQKPPKITELEKSIVIGPENGKKPLPILNDMYCEETHTYFQQVDLITLNKNFKAAILTNKYLKLLCADLRWNELIIQIDYFNI